MRKCLALPFFCWALTAFAQKPLSLVEILSLETPENVRLSPDGSQVLVEISAADWKVNRRISHIWRIGATGGEMVKMTNGVGETNPIWAPDGKQFAFLRRSGERSQIFVQQIAGGEAEQWTHHETTTSQPAWSKDGARIYFVAPEKEPTRSWDDSYHFEHNRPNRHIWEIGGDRKERRVTEGSFDVREFWLGRDGRTLLYVAAPSPLLDDTVRAEIYRLDLTNRERPRLTENSVGESHVRLSSDGNQVLFVAPSDPSLADTYHQPGIFVMPAGGGPPRLLTPDFRGGVTDAEWAEQGILLLGNTGVESQLFRLGPNAGAPEPLTKGPHTVTDFDYAPGPNRWAVVISDGQSAGDVWVGERRITLLNPVLRERALGRLERYRWKGKDGADLDGVVVYPVSYQPGRRYPLVAQIHGGPQGTSKLSFAVYGTNYPQFWSGRGYVAFLPNYRGLHRLWKRVPT